MPAAAFSIDGNVAAIASPPGMFNDSAMSRLNLVANN
jgi:hypothetical protein